MAFSSEIPNAAAFYAGIPAISDPAMSLNPKRTITELKELRELTSDASGAQRVAWTPMWLRARSWFEDKLRGLPVEHHFDSAANRWVTLEGASPKTLLIGSHLDSV